MVSCKFVVFTGILLLACGCGGSGGGTKLTNLKVAEVVGTYDGQFSVPTRSGTATIQIHADGTVTGVLEDPARGTLTLNNSTIEDGGRTHLHGTHPINEVLIGTRDLIGYLSSEGGSLEGILEEDAGDGIIKWRFELQRQQD